MRNILNTLSTIGVLTMAATPLLAVGGMAHAAEARVQPAYIQVAGLDLSRRADVATFRRPVDVAAEAICSQDAVRGLASASVCQDSVREEAVQKLGADQRRDLQSAEAGLSRGWTVAAR